MRDRVALGAVVLVLVLASFGAGVVTGRYVVTGASECSVGGTGDGSTVTIEGAEAAQACQGMATNFGTAILDPGTAPTGEIICQVHFAGLSFTVRGLPEAGPEALSSIDCDALHGLAGY